MAETLRRRPARRVMDRTALFSTAAKTEGDVGLHTASLKAFETQQLPDEFDRLYESSSTVGFDNMQAQKPSYNPYSLLKLPNQNNTLKQCIEAMVTNIEGFGYRLDYIGDDAKQESKEALAEEERLKNFLDYPNDEYSLLELRQRLRRDLETFGYCFMEVIRDALGRVTMIYHLPAHTVRLTAKDADPITVNVELPRDGKVVKQLVRKRFRRYVQLINNRKIYFKEFSDPRMIDPTTGMENIEIGLSNSANEVIHISLHNPGEIYGLPRWINQIPSVMGSWESELTNLQFFKDNAIPAMALLVSGGYVTEETLQDIESHFTAARGRQAMNRIIVIEAMSDENAADDSGKLPVPKIELKPLANERQNDALFQDYEEQNSIKIRSSFRMPPIFLGRSDDYTRSTADTSLIVAESQVFGPERKRIDDIFNLKILATYNPKFWSFRSNPPKITGSEDIMNALSKLNALGAITPNVAIGMANELFDLRIPLIKEAWGDYPVKFTEALLNRGTLAIDSGLQDSIDAATDELSEDGKGKTKDKNKGGDEEEDVAASLLRIRRRLSTKAEERRTNSRREALIRAGKLAS